MAASVCPRDLANLTWDGMRWGFVFLVFLAHWKMRKGKLWPCSQIFTTETFFGDMRRMGVRFPCFPCTSANEEG